MVDQLPQRDVIAEHDVRFWVEEVVERYGELAIWHATRASGFGGSQIGALVRNFLGQRADHSSARDTVEGALLKRVPDEPNGHMQRGIWMEPHHREIFYRRWSARRDEEGFKILSSSTGVRSWMRYSPDELCFMPGAVLNRPAGDVVRVLGDFKAPSEAHGVNFEYQCQLAMGHAICKHAGVRVDALMLSQFDWANWDLRDEWVESNEELEQHIVAAGDHYWNDFVLRGQVPGYVLKPRLDPSDDNVLALAAPLTQLSRLKTLASFVEKQIGRLDEQVRPKLAQLRFGQARLSIGGLSYSASQVVDMEKVKAVLPQHTLERLPLQPGSRKRWDEDKLVATLRSVAPDTDLRHCIKPANLDPEALHSALVAAGLDADSLVTEKLTARVDKAFAEQTLAWAQAHVAHLVGAADHGDASVIHAFGDEGEEDDREGQSSLRHVPSSRS